MRLSFLYFILSFVLASICQGQNTHYLKVNSGPKMDFQSMKNSNGVEIVKHIDYSFSIYGGKRLSKDISLEMGLVRHDHSTVFQLPSVIVNEESIPVFEGVKFGKMKSYQLCLIGSYRKSIVKRWDAYANIGLHGYLSRNSLSNQSSSSAFQRIKVVNGDTETHSLKIYNTQQETKIIVYRADLGFYLNLTERFSLDINLSGRASPKMTHSFDVRYQRDYSPVESNVRVESKAISLGLNVGTKLRIGKL